MLTCYPCALKSSLFPTVFRISAKILKVNIKVLPYSATSSHPRLCILPHVQLHGPPCKSLNMPEGLCTCFTPFRLPPPPAFFASPALTHPPDLSSVVTTLRKASQTPISIRFFFLHELMCMCLLSCFSHGQLFCDPMDHRLPISSVHRILQARILEWVAMSSSRGPSQPWDRIHVSCLLLWQAGSLPLAVKPIWTHRLYIYFSGWHLPHLFAVLFIHCCITYHPKTPWLKSTLSSPRSWDSRNRSSLTADSGSEALMRLQARGQPACCHLQSRRELEDLLPCGLLLITCASTRASQVSSEPGSRLA